MGSISVALKFKQKVLNFCENFTHGKNSQISGMLQV
jgi:hypothetical protein